MVNLRGLRTCTFVLALLTGAFSVWPQNQPAGAGVNDPLALVGMRLEELIEQFGPPVSVAAVRGGEVWQDDVVFQYAQGDFYIYRDRVWQVKLISAFGISLRDPRAAALLVLGNGVEDRGDYLLKPLSAAGWPLMLRVNLNNTGVVSAIFIYRPDY